MATSEPRPRVATAQAPGTWKSHQACPCQSRGAPRVKSRRRYLVDLASTSPCSSSSSYHPAAPGSSFLSIFAFPSLYAGSSRDPGAVDAVSCDSASSSASRTRHDGVDSRTSHPGLELIADMPMHSTECPGWHPARPSRSHHNVVLAGLFHWGSTDPKPPRGLHAACASHCSCADGRPTSANGR